MSLALSKEKKPVKHHTHLMEAGFYRGWRGNARLIWFQPQFSGWFPTFL